MNTYREFHGEIEISQIGKRLREIAKKEPNNFKIMTGYGSSSGFSRSKEAVLKSLRKMVKEKLIKGFLPGEIKDHLLSPNSKFFIYLEDKLLYEPIINKDFDYGNPGIIFVFK